jgi:putative ABC transport system ATP-binding protein
MDLLFAQRARHGTTLILITHDMALAHRCDRVVHVKDGLITGEEPGRDPWSTDTHATEGAAP